MPSPTLSVCIPTYNRLHYLKEALAVLLPQAELHGVEVCISDNRSTDGTSQYLAALVSKGAPALRYVVQVENIGLDRNMMASICMGSGQYIYPIGDDDLLPDGSLRKILEEVKKSCDLLILNGWHTDPTLAPKRKHLSDDIAGASFSQPDQAFLALWDKMPFGSFLASRDCFAINYFKRYIGTSHAYAGSVWDALADRTKAEGGCMVRCMEVPTVLLRGAEKSWSKNAAAVMLYEIPVWFALLSEKDAYSHTAPLVRRTYMANQTRLLSLAQFRVIGQLDNARLSNLCRECSKVQKLKVALISNTPRVVLMTLIKARGALKSIWELISNSACRRSAY